ncbi:hypothetical protein MRS44_013989 [Fusarium solani]|uniref:uncharacterized protein n=1 Tax=Fusarium solani TaxID=169388 RepID=UPI0032C4AF5E|nr:hypothetical protein MRS44_013989 [Fusarium solani]
MDNSTQTPVQESAATVEVARGFDNVENVPLCDSLAPPYDVSHDDLSSDAECKVDATNEPQSNGSPVVLSKSTAEFFAGRESRGGGGFEIGQGGGLIDNGNNESIFVFDQSDTDASSAASYFSIDRDDESELSATSDYNDGRDDESTLTVASENRKVDYKHGRGYQAGHEYWLVECMPRQLPPANRVHKLAERRTAMWSIGHVNVLDVGTGTGIWAIDFADEHPSAQVIGTDISPIQPEWVPSNLEFQLDDANLEWTFKERFEFIYGRRMVGSITDWVEFAKKAFAALQPGGYLECHELSMSFRSDDKTHENCESMMRWEGFWNDVGNKSGRSFTVVEDRRLEKSMQLAGFTGIETRVYKMPVGGWPKDARLKEVGLYTHAAIDMDLEGLLFRPAVEVLGWSLEEATMFAVQLRKELRSRKVHAYIPLKVVFGQKP